MIVITGQTMNHTMVKYTRANLILNLSFCFKYLENALSIFPIPKPDSKSDNDGKAYDGNRPDIAWSEYQSRMVYGIFRCIHSFLINKKPLHDLSIMVIGKFPQYCSLIYSS